MTEKKKKKSNYKLMKGKWKIGILLEAGYQIVSVKDNLEKYIKLTDHIYFQSMLLPYPYSQPLSDAELIYFCDGITMVNKYISLSAMKDTSLSIALRYIQFSECNIQKEAFTASAIQWASEMFQFSMPDINAYFDSTRSIDGMNGSYVFDFSGV